MKQRILVLGGSPFQVPLIRRAKERGLHVITCDYLPDNPGHALADEYHNVSTTDKEGVLALARRMGIDAVATLSSDPALPSVSYVANALGLPGAPLSAIVQLGEKDAFRALMRSAGLRTPATRVLTETDARDLGAVAIELAASGVRYIVKPVDSCGSKGITVMEPGAGGLDAAVQVALAHSMGRRCIIEQYVDGPQIHGDGFMQGGRLVHHYLGDHVFYTRTRNRIPISTRWPCRYGDDVLGDMASQVERVCSAAGYMDGPVNIEARVTPAGDVYLIEVAPRNGGNYVPVIQQHLTGFDFVERVLDGALGIQTAVDAALIHRGVGAHYILHAHVDGRFDGVTVSDEIQRKVFRMEVFKHRGDPVRQYVGSNTSLGVLLMQFEDVQERDTFMKAIEQHVVLL
jgi:biotin carboxylase